MAAKQNGLVIISTLLYFCFVSLYDFDDLDSWRIEY